jgi:hypothetical protein
MARTAVVAGTATAVSNRVSRRQAGRWAEQAPPQQQYQEPPQQYQQPPPQQYQQPVAAAPAGTGSDDLIDQLQKLAALRDQGILTDAEFDTQKAKLLAS